MYKSFLANFAGIFIVALVDICLVSALPFGLNRIHFLFIAIIMILILSNIRLAAWWALGGAMILEAFSFRFFGTYLIVAFIVLSLAYFLFEKVMTNRSVYSVMVVTAAVTAIADIIFLILDYWTVHDLGTITSQIISFILSVVFNVIAAVIIFYLFSALTRRLKPVFVPFLRN